MYILVFLIYLVSGKTHFDNYYYRDKADFYRVNKPVRQIFLTMGTFHIVKKRRLWGKMGSKTKSCCIRICVISTHAITRLTCIYSKNS